MRNIHVIIHTPRIGLSLYWHNVFIEFGGADVYYLSDVKYKGVDLDKSRNASLEQLAE